MLIGATGRAGRFIAQKLSQACIPFRTLIRNLQRREFFTQLGAEVAVQDLNTEFHNALKGIGALIDAPGSAETEGAEQAQPIDRDAITRTVDYARQQNARRLILISALVAADASYAPTALKHYVEMKQQTDDYVSGSGINDVTLPPGPPTLAPGKGAVQLTGNPADREPASREDAAEVALAALQQAASNRVIGFAGGATTIGTAVPALQSH